MELSKLAIKAWWGCHACKKIMVCLSRKRSVEIHYIQDDRSFWMKEISTYQSIILDECATTLHLLWVVFVNHNN